MLENHDLFDWSGYSIKHPVFYGMHEEDIKKLQAQNKKAIGKMKDECDGFAIEEFAGIRSKCYSFRVFPADEKEFFNSGRRITRKDKGIKKSTIQNEMRHQDYVDCLLKDQGLNVKFPKL